MFSYLLLIFFKALPRFYTTEANKGHQKYKTQCAGSQQQQHTIQMNHDISSSKFSAQTKSVLSFCHFRPHSWNFKQAMAEKRMQHSGGFWLHSLQNGTLWPPTTSQAIARADSVLQRHISFMKHFIIPHYATWLYRHGYETSVLYAVGIFLYGIRIPISVHYTDLKFLTCRLSRCILLV